MQKDLNKSDSENATLGVILGGMFLLLGFIVLFTNPQMGIFAISLSIFPLCETVKGIISIRNRKIISNPLYIQSEELKSKVEGYNKKLKIISKIKLLNFIILILIVIIIVMTN